MKKLVIGVLTAAAVLTGGGMAQAAAPTAGLSVSVAGGVAQVHAGDRLHYEVTVTDTAGAEHKGVRLELTLPVGARATKVTDGKAPEPWFASWTTTVPSGGATTLTADFVAGKPAAGTKGYAVSACVVAGGIRLTCAGRVEQLAGAASVHALTPPAPAPVWPYWVAGVVVVLLAAAYFVWLRLRRRRVGVAEEVPEREKVAV